MVDNSGTGKLREGDSDSSRPDDVSIRIWRSESETKAILWGVEAVSGREALRSPGERISHYSVKPDAQRESTRMFSLLSGEPSCRASEAGFILIYSQ